jgi:hypothetical protein
VSLDGTISGTTSASDTFGYADTGVDGLNVSIVSSSGGSQSPNTPNFDLNPSASNPTTFHTYGSPFDTGTLYQTDLYQVPSASASNSALGFAAASAPSGSTSPPAVEDPRPAWAVAISDAGTSISNFLNNNFITRSIQSNGPELGQSLANSYVVHSVQQVPQSWWFQNLIDKPLTRVATGVQSGVLTVVGNPYVISAGKIVQGGVEGAGALPLLFAPEPTLLTKVAGVGLAFHAGDTAWAGVVGLWKGKVQQVLMKRRHRHSLKELR